MRMIRPAELLAAARETVTPIALALETAPDPRLAPGQSRPAVERSSLRRAAHGKLSGTVAKSRRWLSQPPLQTATARRTVSCHPGWLPVPGWLPAVATGRGNRSEAGRVSAQERLLRVRNRAALGIRLGTEATSRHSLCRRLWQTATVRRTASSRFRRARLPQSQLRSQRLSRIELPFESRPPAQCARLLGIWRPD
jgi:hypothetical protein